MKRPAWIVGWLIAGCVALAMSGLAARASPEQSSVLAEVKELEKPVTYTETKIPLGELVQKVATDTGVPLTAVPGVADEPVAVVVKALPARELLEQLADLLDYQWHRLPGRPTPNTEHPIHPLRGYPTYEIWQDLASKQREEALREGVLAEVEKRFREELKQYVEVAALPPEEFQRLVAAAAKEAQERGNLTPEEQQALLRQPDERARRLRFSAALALRSPVYRSEASLLGRLTASQWTRLSDEGAITFSTDPQPGELKLTPETERLLRASPPTYLPAGAHLAFPDPGEEEKIYQRQKGLQEAWAAATGFRVFIRLDTSRMKTEGGLNLNADVTPFRSGEPLQLNFMTPGTALYLMAGPRFLGQEAEEDTPERRAAMEKDPAVGARKLFKPEAKPRPSDNGPGAPSWWPFWDLLPDLARTCGVQFIADSYWHNAAGVLVGSIPQEPAPLFSLLDRAAGSTHRWDHRGSLIRLRSRTWFFDRAREVPLHFVRRWKDLLKAHAALPLDAYLEMGAALSDAQFETLGWLVRAAGLPPDFYSVGESRHALRLYNALRPPQQQALWAGQPLPVAQMIPPQRALFAAGLNDRLRHDPPALAQAKAASGAFLITTEPLVRISEGRENSASYRDEPASTSPAPTVTPGSPARYPVTRIRFHFQSGPDLDRTAVLIIASPPGP